MSDSKASASSQQAVMGLLGGMAYTSSLDYYRFVNHELNRRLGKMNGSHCIMYSTNLEECMEFLRVGKNEEFKQLMLDRARKLKAAGSDFLVICSNTAHSAYDLITSKLPSFPILHIGDTTATAIKRAGFTRCGFLGTIYAMENPTIQLDRYKEHGLNVTPPRDTATRAEVWRVIEKELAVDKIIASSREFYIRTIRELVKREGAQCVILGCTEIPLLVKQSDVPEVPLFDTTQLHALAAVDVQTRVTTVDSYLPDSRKKQQQQKKLNAKL